MVSDFIDVVFCETNSGEYIIGKAEPFSYLGKGDKVLLGDVNNLEVAEVKSVTTVSSDPENNANQFMSCVAETLLGYPELEPIAGKFIEYHIPKEGGEENDTTAGND